MMHASQHEHDATILVHDFALLHNVYKSYKELLSVCDEVDYSGGKLVALKRKEDVTDEMLHEIMEFGSNSAR